MSSRRAFELIAAKPSHADELQAARDALEEAGAELGRALVRFLAAEMASAVPARAAAQVAPSGDRAPAGADVVNVEEAMKILRLSRDSLYKQLKSRAIPSLKIGGRRLFRRSDLEAFLSKQVERNRW